MEKIIFGLVSQMAGGKETVKKYLEKNYQAKSCRFSSIMRDILDRLYLDKSRNNIQKLSTGLRQIYGEDILAQSITKEVKALKAKILVVDGVRRQADIKYLNDLDNFYLVAIEAKPEIRYQRLIKRAENVGDSEKTYEEFLAEHAKEADKQIPLVMKKAHFIIDNNGNLQELYNQIDKLVKDRQNK
jgi:dephospho-CoA kinase